MISRRDALKIGTLGLIGVPSGPRSALTASPLRPSSANAPLIASKRMAARQSTSTLPKGPRLDEAIGVRWRFRTGGDSWVSPK